MNTLQLLKANPRYEKSLSNNSSQLPLDNSRVIKRKVPQSRLSYLKKLFANNMEAQSIAQNKETKALHEEIRAFEKSKIIRHSDKNLAKYILRQVPKNYQLQPINRKDNLRYNPIVQTQFLPFGHPKNHQKTDLNQSFDPYYNNEIQNLDKSKPIIRKQKIQSQSRPVYFTHEKASHSLHESPSYSKGKYENQGMIEAQDNNRVKKQLKELRKIGRMLDDIKCQILKNRSMIIEGINEIKDIDVRRTKNRSIDFDLLPEYELDQSDYILLEQQKPCVAPQNHTHSIKQTDRHKPKIQYTKFYQMR